MGRSPCCDKVGLKKGPWTPEEDQKLLAYIEEHGHGSWRALPAKAGLQRCGKSCRLRWTNYLRPDIKRGKFSLQEEQTIIQLHALLGNRWSAIATHLPKRTDNEIKNYWNTHLKKRLAKMGIDPVTHKPKNDALLISSADGQSKNAANLSHMAQWESARLEAEARLVRESKLRSHSSFQHQLGTPVVPLPATSLGLTKVGWNNGVWPKSTEGTGSHDLESPTSTLTYSENAPPVMTAAGIGETSMPLIEFVGTTSGSNSEAGTVKDEREQADWKPFENSTHWSEYKEGMENSLCFTSNLHDISMSMEGTWSTSPESLRTSTRGHVQFGNVVMKDDHEEGFTNLFLNNSDDHQSLSDGGDNDSENGRGSGNGSDYYEDNKNYWNSILNLVNSSPSDSPMF